MVARKVIHDRVAEVEWLLSDTYAGTTPDDIAARLGYAGVDSLRRVMRRAGRYDLSDRRTERMRHDDRGISQRQTGR